jgi:chromosome segregation ATPase
LDAEREHLRASLSSKLEQITSLISQLKESESDRDRLTKELQELLESQETLIQERDNLDKRLEKAKEYFNAKRVEDESKLAELESAKQGKLSLEKKIILSGEEAMGLKEEIARLVSEISRFVPYHHLLSSLSVSKISPSLPLSISREESHQRELREVLDENMKIKTTLEVLVVPSIARCVFT